MGSGSSAVARAFAAPSRAVVLVMLAAVLGVDLGPERYFGLDADLLQWAIVGLFALYALASRSLSGGTGARTDPETPAATGEHYRATSDAREPGVYRVVGADGSVALLRVATSGGQRVHTGEVIRVDQARMDADFEAADDPDAGFTPVRGTRNALSGLYWTVRKRL